MTPSRPARRLLVGLAPLALVAGLAAGCSDDGSDAATASDPSSPDTEAAPTSTEAGSDASAAEMVRNDGLRGIRYCEVLLLEQGDDGYRAEVWNTMGLSDCPQDEWDALDPTALAAESDAEAAILNGPRYWTLDVIEQGMRAGAEERTFGTIPMFLAADVALGDELPSQEPYVERSVGRDTVFEWAPGEPTYQLTDPAGTLYVMQSYSNAVDPDLTAEDLPGLGDRLALPDGWTYAVVTPETALRLLSDDGTATVVRDELQNTYQRFDADL